MEAQFNNSLYLELERMISAGLIEKVVRPDGEIGYALTYAGNLAADAALERLASVDDAGDVLH